MAKRLAIDGGNPVITEPLPSDFRLFGMALRFACYTEKLELSRGSLSRGGEGLSIHYRASMERETPVEACRAYRQGHSQSYPSLPGLRRLGTAFSGYRTMLCNYGVKSSFFSNILRSNCQIVGFLLRINQKGWVVGAVNDIALAWIPTLVF